MQYPTYIKTVGVKRKRQKLKIILYALILSFVFYKAYGVKTDLFGGGASESVFLEIKTGASLNETAQLLKEQKIIKYPLLFKIYSRISGASNGVQLGGHALTKDMSYSQILKTISQITTPVHAVTVTITEGSELMQTAQKLSDAFAQKGLGFDIDTFLEECKNGQFEYQFIRQIPRQENLLEGYLFPATYTFTEDVTEHDVIDAMLAKFDSEYTADFKERAQALGLTTYEVITLASIIEREGAGTDEFKVVSSVFHNRIKNNMRLESCATVQYVLGERKEVLSTADTRTPSPYNTYLHFGLPVGPIASPGAAAIEAALYPADTDYLYFRLNEGRHVFSKTYREHMQAR